jgi:bacillithiol biosynthesis deacetylase BshB1
MASDFVDILAFGAHADDVELSCGGTVAKAVKQGQKVGIVDLTHAEMGTRGSPEIRLRESKVAARVLKAQFRRRLNFGDGALRTGRDEELELIRLIREVRPAIVIAPYTDDRHPDHSRAGRLITEACFYAGLARIETGQAAHRPQAVVYHLLTYAPHPSFVVDISSTFGTKMKAIRSYASQFYNPKSKEKQTILSQKTFLDRIEARARYFGSMIGAEYGEPFWTKEPPAVADLVAAYSGREVS